MLLLRVTYRVRAHQIAPFEEIFRQRIMQVIRRHDLRFRGIWKTVVGEVGEFLELWEFESMAEFEERWGGLMRDPDLLEIFEETGPMVEGERFALMEPAAEGARGLGRPERYQV